MSGKQFWEYDPVADYEEFERRAEQACRRDPSLCEECGGDGEMPNGKKCKVCKGSGKRDA